MLARLGSRKDLKRPDHIFEPKMDGTRAICYKNERLRFINRRKNDITYRYPEFDFLDNIRAENAVLDGEVVVYDNQGNPSFRLLQKRENASSKHIGLWSKQHPATYVVFDLLMLNGEDITALSLGERKERLAMMVEESENLQTMFFTSDGEELWSLIEERDVEGVMAKSVDGAYEQGKRSASWLKIKTLRSVDCIIVGYTHEKRIISALALGLYDEEEIIYVGSVGTGFTEHFLERLHPVLEGIRSDGPSVNKPPKKGILWVEPRIVCEVQYLELTGGGHLRAPSFKRVRVDKPPEDCTIDSIL